MAATIALATLLTLAPVTPEATSAPSSAGDTCTRWDGRGWPSSIRVFVIHHRGSSIPAYVRTVPFREYVGTVLASGAFPAWEPMELIKAGAVVVAARAAYLVRHHDSRFRWGGRCFDIISGSAPRWCPGCDMGQLYRPGTYVHSRIRRAVASVAGTQLRRHGRLAKPQWSGEGHWCGDGYTGNRLPAGGAAACARQGHGWRWILHRYMPRTVVVP